MQIWNIYALTNLSFLNNKKKDRLCNFCFQETISLKLKKKFFNL